MGRRGAEAEQPDQSGHGSGNHDHRTPHARVAPMVMLPAPCDLSAGAAALPWPSHQNENRSSWMLLLGTPSLETPEITSSLKPSGPQT